MVNVRAFWECDTKTNAEACRESVSKSSKWDSFLFLRCKINECKSILWMWEVELVSVKAACKRGHERGESNKCESVLCVCERWKYYMRGLCVWGKSCKCANGLREYAVNVANSRAVSVWEVKVVTVGRFRVRVRKLGNARDKTECAERLCECEVNLPNATVFCVNETKSSKCECEWEFIIVTARVFWDWGP